MENNGIKGQKYLRGGDKIIKINEILTFFLKLRVDLSLK